MGLLSRIKLRKSKGMPRVRKAYKEYKRSGGSLTYKEFKAYYRKRIQGEEVETLDRAPYGLDDVLNGGGSLLESIFDAMGVDNPLSDDELEGELNEIDNEDDSDPTKLDFSLTGNIFDFIPIPNYVIYMLIGYFYFKPKKRRKR